MATITDRKEEAICFLKEQWGEEKAEEIICLCDAHPLNMHRDDFMKHVTMCGGDWGAMLLSGIKALAPEVYEAIPENLGWCGTVAFCALCYTLELLNVDCAA